MAHSTDCAELRRYGVDPRLRQDGEGSAGPAGKVPYLLQLKGDRGESIESLTDEDMDDFLTLFGDLNNATHGHAGRSTLPN